LKATILSIGTELLFGQIVNTNTTYLSKQLQLLGIDVLYHFTVGDNEDRMRNAILRSFEETDLIITTGGLGPTQDDATKEIIAEVMNDKLELDQSVLDGIQSFFDRIGREMTENNKKQAYLPSRCEPFYNDVGTAPGFALENDGKIVIALPGPPREMTYMFQKSGLPYLESKTNSVIFYKILRMWGIGESQLETDLLPLIDVQTDPTLATYAKEGECSVRIASKRATLEEAKQAVAEMEANVMNIVGEFVYSDNDEDLQSVTLNALKTEGLKLATAESCTGGLFAKTMTDFAGSSAVLDRGWVTYSNEAKTDMLGVDADIIATKGAVSPEVAAQMATGALSKSNADISISVTGIAGPDGGSEEKPVGLAYIGIATKDGVHTYKYFSNNKGREWNRYNTMIYMCGKLLAQIKSL
jgi:nicotinamide-nucleotide amidase